MKKCFPEIGQIFRQVIHNKLCFSPIHIGFDDNRCGTVFQKINSVIIRLHRQTVFIGVFMSLEDRFKIVGFTVALCTEVPVIHHLFFRSRHGKCQQQSRTHRNHMFEHIFSPLYWLFFIIKSFRK